MPPTSPGALRSVCSPRRPATGVSSSPADIDFETTVRETPGAPPATSEPSADASRGWSQRAGSNRRPADYESDALPVAFLEREKAPAVWRWVTDPQPAPCLSYPCFRSIFAIVDLVACARRISGDRNERRRGERPCPRSRKRSQKAGPAAEMPIAPRSWPRCKEPQGGAGSARGPWSDDRAQAPTACWSSICLRCRSRPLSNAWRCPWPRRPGHSVKLGYGRPSGTPAWRTSPGNDLDAPDAGCAISLAWADRWIASPHWPVRCAAPTGGVRSARSALCGWARLLQGSRPRRGLGSPVPFLFES